jgi:transposase
MTPDALQRKHDLRAVFDAVRSLAHTGVQWRYLPGDFPPWPAVYQQARRWMEAGAFAAALQDLRLLLRVLKGRTPQPTAASLDARVVQSPPESGARAGSSGHQRRKGSKVHAAVDTLGHQLALTVTAANEDERTPVSALAEQVQEVTGQHVEIASVDEGYEGPNAATAAAPHGIEVVVVQLPEAKRGFVLLPKRWVVERTLGWVGRWRRTSKDYEYLPATSEGVASAIMIRLMLRRLADSEA